MCQKKQHVVKHIYIYIYKYIFYKSLLCFTHTQTHTHTQMYIYMCVCVCVCVWVCVWVCLVTWFIHQALDAIQHQFLRAAQLVRIKMFPSPGWTTLLWSKSPLCSTIYPELRENVRRADIELCLIETNWYRNRVVEYLNSAHRFHFLRQ